MNEFWDTFYDKGCVLFIGYGDSAKGSNIAVKIAGRLPEIPFIFIGNDIKKETLKKNVLFCPRQPDICSLFMMTKILIVPSLCNEAYCRLIAEVNVFNKQCRMNRIITIASNRGGIPEAKPDILIDDPAYVLAWVMNIKQEYHKR